MQPPHLERQHGSQTNLPLAPPSWADLAEDDPEMQLMGPPQFVPSFLGEEWILPKRSARPQPIAKIGGFLKTHNQFATLMHQLAPQEVEEVRREWVGDIQDCDQMAAYEPVASESLHLQNISTQTPQDLPASVS